jgi:hypothetical protein
MAQLGKDSEIDANGTALSGITFREIGQLGAMKVEVFNITTPSALDYFFTRLSRPVGAVARCTGDAGGSATNPLIWMVGKQIVFRATHTGGVNVGVIVFGY